MTYNIGIIGQKFLYIMKVEYDYIKYFNPGATLDMLTNEKDKKAFKISIFNDNFYLRAANEIMEKIFTPNEKEKLKNLIAELEREENSLITSARSEVSKTINKHKSGTPSLHDYNSLKFGSEEFEKWLNGIVVGVFEMIPPHALNLLGLIKVNKEKFPQSYNLFKLVLDTLNQGEALYDPGKIKEHFTQALEELEKLVESVKKKKPDKTKKKETANVGEENVENETPPEQTPPNQNQSEGDKNVPTDSNEKPEGQNDSENNENTNEPNNDASSNLQTLKTQVISEITTALNKTPLLNNSDLSSEYQDWENEINNLSDKDQINFLKTSVLFHIEKQRKEKVKKQTTGEVSEIINSNLQKVQNPDATIQEKKAALVENEQYEGQSAYEDTQIKEQTKNLKKEVARDNLTEYRDKVISDLTTKLEINYLKESELDPETKSEIEALRNETDPDKLVEKEVKITQKIGQQGATKKITRFEKKIETALESNDKTEIDKLKKQLIEFIGSNNIYYQAKKKEAQELLKQLESGSIINNSDSSETLPFSTQIGVGMGAVLVVLFFTLLIWKKKRQAFFKAHLTKN